jgi:hypothetical protein
MPSHYQGSGDTEPPQTTSTMDKMERGRGVEPHVGLWTHQLTLLLIHTDPDLNLSAHIY